MRKITKKRLQDWMNKVNCITDHRKPETAYKDFYKLFHADECWALEAYYNDFDGFDEEYAKEIKSLLTQGAKDLIDSFGSYYLYGYVRRELYDHYDMNYNSCYFDLVD